LNTGIPILFHAPKYSSVFKFIEKHNTGFVISSNDEEEFKKDFEKILNSKVGERRMISENAIRLLKNKYAFSNQRLEFIDLILN
jgi:glycosyltransferase involved in cell wall biosynthesis